MATGRDNGLCQDYNARSDTLSARHELRSLFKETTMNAMTQAMSTAGIKMPPLNKRVWLWIKDHPEKTYTDIASALNVAPSTVASALTDLTARGMLTIYQDRSRKAGIGGMQYMVRRYSVKYKEFELLPRLNTVKKVKAVQPAPVAPAPVVRDVLGTGTADTPKTKAVLTEAEKFAAFLEFKALMKEMK